MNGLLFKCHKCEIDVIAVHYHFIKSQFVSKMFQKTVSFRISPLDWRGLEHTACVAVQVLFNSIFVHSHSQFSF